VLVVSLAICVRSAHAASGAFNLEVLPSLDTAILNEAAEAWDVVNGLSAAIETGEVPLNGSDPDYAAIARNMNSVIHTSRMVKSTLWLHYYSTNPAQSFGYTMQGLAGVEGEYSFYHDLDDVTCAQYNKFGGCSVEVPTCQDPPRPPPRRRRRHSIGLPSTTPATALCACAVAFRHATPSHCGRTRCRRTDTSRPRRACLKG
jgi:hypothetical protein